MQSEDREVAQTHAFVEEAEELGSIVCQVVDSQGVEATAVFPRFSQLITKYQEQAQLLDPLLEELVKPLARLLADLAPGYDPATPASTPIHAVARLLWQLSAVRGTKAVLRFFPNEVANLEPVVGLLEALEAAGTGRPQASFDEGGGLWEAQHVCLLWLALLVLVPFDLALVDTSLASSAAGAATVTVASAAGYPPIVGSILRMCRHHLASPGSSRELAAVVLGRLVTRPDMDAALQESLEWGCQALQEPADSPQAAFQVPGVALAFATLFKLGRRSTLLESRLAVSNALARKLAVKLAQRIGLVFLRPRLASWRYQKPRLNMAFNLARAAAGVPAGSSSVVGPDMADIGPPAAADANATVVTAEEAAEAEVGEDMVAAAEQLEVVIEALMRGLGDKDTVVRWSAAKGLGRLTMRLPKDLADDVVAAVLEGFFAPSASDTAWHGGCLAVAELASRGLLLPERLPEVAPLVVQALEYDVRRGPCSVGANVRDAAAYVCWALARAYSPAALGPTVHALAPALITCACYDREVNCRRAAAAAFQECVGRLGNFPHGIDVVTTADYFAVSVRSVSYLTVAPAVAAFPEYFEPFAWHLLRNKLRHWEKSLRELAAQATAALVPHRPPFFISQALPFLLPLCTDGVLEVRHGAMAGVAELLLALRSAGAELSPATLAQVAGVLPAVEAAKLARGKGGEVMRSAICRLIETSACVDLPLSSEQQACMWRQLCDNLRHASPDTQAAAAAALAAFAAHYLPRCAPADQEQLVVGRFLADLTDRSSPPARRGAALALGMLPAWLLAPTAQTQVLPALAEATQVEAVPEQRDAETRVNAIRALEKVALSLHAWHLSGGAADGKRNLRPAAAAGLEVALSTAQVLLAALGDYSIDNRGDVGSWVREAAMEGLVSLLLAVLQPPAAGPDSASAAGEQQLEPQPQGQLACGLQAERMQALVQEVTAALLKQAVERIAHVREVAGCQLQRLLQAAGAAGTPPVAAAELAAAVEGRSEEDFGTLEALPTVAALLVHPQYQQPLLEGLAFSIGGLDRQLGEAAAEALVRAANLLNGKKCSELAASLLTAWAAHTRSGRLCTPLLLTAEVLLARTGVADVQQLPLNAANLQQPDAPATTEPRVATEGRFFPAQLLSAVREAVRGCTDIPRLQAGIAVLCQLAGAGGAVGRDSLRTVLLLLANRYPKVRRCAAEQVYTLLLTLDMGEGQEQPSTPHPHLDAAMELLLEVAWDGPLEAVKVARARVFSYLQLPPPAPPAAVASSGGIATQQMAPAAPAQSESYAALLDRAARNL
eukprot:scaffold18.g1994.t1